MYHRCLPLLLSEKAPWEKPLFLTSGISPAAAQHLLLQVISLKRLCSVPGLEETLSECFIILVCYACLACTLWSSKCGGVTWEISNLRGEPQMYFLFFMSSESRENITSFV